MSGFDWNNNPNVYGACVGGSVLTKDTSWNNPMIQTSDKCPFGTHGIPKVLIPSNIYGDLMSITNKLSTEFTAILMAELTEENDWLINDYVIPEQEVTATTVDIKEDLPGQGIFHSHVNMSASFSGTDEEHANNCHDFSIVGNKKGETTGVVMVEVPCGIKVVVDTKVEVIAHGLEAALEKIKTKTYTVAHGRVNRGGYHGRVVNGVTKPNTGVNVTVVNGSEAKDEKDKVEKIQPNGVLNDMVKLIETWFFENDCYYLGYDVGLDAFTGIQMVMPYDTVIIYTRQALPADENEWTKPDTILRARMHNGELMLTTIKEGVAVYENSRA